MDNLYQRVNEGQNTAINTIKNAVQKYLIFIVLGFNVILNVLSKFYALGLKNPFSAEFFLELAINLTTTMICYICFIPFGSNDEKKRTTIYKQNISLWSTLTETVRVGFLDLFRKFCEEQVNSERDEVKRLILGNNTITQFDDYKAKYEGKSKEEIELLRKNGEITKQEEKAINRANGYGWFNPTKIKPINPVIILSGVHKQKINDAGRTDNAYVARWLTIRPLIIFVTTAVINAITTSFIGTGANAILSMLLSVLTIVVSSVCGYSAGVTSVKKNDEKVKSRILFLSLFFEKNGIEVKSLKN